MSKSKINSIGSSWDELEKKTKKNNKKKCGK